MKIGSHLPTAQSLQRQALEPQAARQTLQDLAANLTNAQTGRIQGGYLRLTASGSMNAGHMFTQGSHASAAETIKKLVEQAYGPTLGPEKLQAVNTALATYLLQSGGALGTRSFVKLIKALEFSLPRDDGQGPKIGGGAARTIQSRLDLPKALDNPHREIGLQVRSLREKAGSPIPESAVKQFHALAWTMSQLGPSEGQWTWRNDFLAFKGLMFPKNSRLNPANAPQRVDAPRTFAMGDADGSMGRMVLHAIASGVAELPQDHMPALARLMRAEVHALQANGGMAAYQADMQVSADLEEVASKLIVHPRPQAGKPACIFLGDILSDRFTNNQEAMSKLIYKLSGISDPQNPSQRIDTGVCFIAGNHDTVPLVKPDGTAFDVDEALYGTHATKKLPWDAYTKLLIDCFKAADYSDGVLTTHNGVVKGGIKAVNSDPKTKLKRPHIDVYLVGVSRATNRGEWKAASGSMESDCGAFKASSPKELAEKMNIAFVDRLKTKGPLNAVATDFRPEDKDMSPKAMGFSHVRGFRQLHGHNANANEDQSGVTNLNARGEGGIHQYLPVATVIEYADRTV